MRKIAVLLVGCAALGIGPGRGQGTYRIARNSLVLGYDDGPATRILCDRRPPLTPAA